MWKEKEEGKEIVLGQVSGDLGAAMVNYLRQISQQFISGSAVRQGPKQQSLTHLTWSFYLCRLDSQKVPATRDMYSKDSK